VLALTSFQAMKNCLCNQKLDHILASSLDKAPSSDSENGKAFWSPPDWMMPGTCGHAGIWHFDTACLSLLWISRTIMELTGDRRDEEVWAFGGEWGLVQQLGGCVQVCLAHFTFFLRECSQFQGRNPLKVFLVLANTNMPQLFHEMVHIEHTCHCKQKPEAITMLWASHRNGQSPLKKLCPWPDSHWKSYEEHE